LKAVVSTVSLRFQGGNRRRRVLVVASNNPNSSPIVTAAARNRVVIVPRPPLRPTPPVDRVVAVHTAYTTGGTPPPNNNGGGSPRPLQPNWIVGALRARYPKPFVRAIVAHTTYKPPTKDGLPNQVVVVDPQRRPVVRRSVVVRPEFKWGVNHGKTPIAPVVVRRPVGLRVPQPIVVASPPTSGLGFLPSPSRPIVIPRQKPTRTRGSLMVLGFADAGDRVRANPIVAARPPLRKTVPHPIIASTVESFAIRPTQPHRPIIIPCAVPKRRRGSLMVLGFSDAGEIPPASVIAPTVVAFHPRPSDRRRPPIVVRPLPAFNPSSVPPPIAHVVAIPRGRKAAPWRYDSQFLKFVPPPPRHDPMPRILGVPIPRRRSPLMWPTPQVRTSILQPDDQRYTKPWDLIAACIAHLRSDPAIVAAFGDAKGVAGKDKFVSDVELPKTDLPYAIFDEPDESEDYETQDQTNRYSSTIRGVFHLTVLADEKLAARRLGDMAAASLNDAPLVFQDGVLMYLRRSERRFPIVAATGPGPNVTMFKRVVEFMYMIERFF
jgi:hypothetical protein